MAEYDFSVKFTVLEVYPSGQQLKEVVDVYAPGQIDVISMSIDDFNNNQPNISQYDMIMFGFGDCYSSKDISDTMASKVEDFIASGKGVLLSHDTIGNSTKNFMKYFAKYLNIDIGSYYQDEYWSGNTVYQTKKGKLTEYPFELGEVISIAPSHYQWYRTGADVWYAANVDDPQGSWFVASFQNVVHIASGHSSYSCSGAKGSVPLKDSPEKELQLLINTVHYTSQFRQSDIVEEPTAKISAISSSGVTGLYYNGNTVSLSVYDEYLPNGNIIKYEWKVTEKFGSQKTYSYSTAKPSFTINAPAGIKAKYEIKVRIYDEMNVPSEWIIKTIEVTD